MQISLAGLDALHAEGSRLPVEVPDLLVRLRMFGFGSVAHLRTCLARSLPQPSGAGCPSWHGTSQGMDVLTNVLCARPGVAWLSLPILG